MVRAYVLAAMFLVWLLVSAGSVFSTCDCTDGDEWYGTCCPPLEPKDEIRKEEIDGRSEIQTDEARSTDLRLRPNSSEARSHLSE